MAIATQSLTLEAFLELPETKPASEFLEGRTTQKPMPQGEHSLLQGKLCEAINRVAQAEKVAMAFPELRCTFGNQSIVPDLVVFRWPRIPVKASGRIENRFFLHPDWAIEILSPDQSSTRVLGNLLHCSSHGTELGWLIDPEAESVFVVLPEQRVQLLRGNAQLPVLPEISLDLSVDVLFSWLTLN
ncbi:MAG: Uma2 family endonuclease [Cyanobacteria bacterium P01_A01_bin.123]